MLDAAQARPTTTANRLLSVPQTPPLLSAWLRYSLASQLKRAQLLDGYHDQRANYGCR
jgi:hypothetical protein